MKILPSLLALTGLLLSYDLLDADQGPLPSDRSAAAGAEVQDSSQDYADLRERAEALYERQSYERSRRAYEAAAKLELSEAEISAFLGQTDEDLFGTICERHELAADVSRLVATKATHFFECIAHGLVPNPGVPELLLHLTMRGVEAVVASSSPPDVIDAVVGRLGLRRSR